MTIKEIHLAGAFGIPAVVSSNQTHRAIDNWTSFFPFWKICPNLPVYDASTRPASPEAVLIVINMNKDVLDGICDVLPLYGRKILVQFEGYLGWEAAYENCEKFDGFINFDRTYSNHPGFFPLRIPYFPNIASSHMDKRGLAAMLDQRRYSGRVFLDIYLLRFLPRHRKAVMIAGLINRPHYQNRLQVAHQFRQFVDVYGKAWPKEQVAWRGRCGSKMEVLRRYRYALVMENQRQPGYVSEKLLDAVIAGTVPIYWGAPDINDLPGHEAIIIMDDLNPPLERYLADNSDYHRRRDILRREKRRLLELFNAAHFTEDLHKAILGI